ncbi:MAG: peptidase S41, partial [Bacteroidota bacterium]
EEINLSKQNDLEEHRGEIKEYLEEEIVSRYYFEDGAIQASFDFDPDVLKAVKILNDPAEYTSLLDN